jgi:hypothetical protein
MKPQKLLHKDRITAQEVVSEDKQQRKKLE